MTFLVQPFGVGMLKLTFKLDDKKWKKNYLVYFTLFDIYHFVTACLKNFDEISLKIQACQEPNIDFPWVTGEKV